MTDYSKLVSSIRDINTTRQARNIQTAPAAGFSSALGDEISALSTAQVRNAAPVSSALQLGSVRSADDISAVNVSSVKKGSVLSDDVMNIIDDASDDLYDSLLTLEDMDEDDLIDALETLGMEEEEMLRSGNLASVIAIEDGEDGPEAVLTVQDTAELYSAALEKWQEARNDLAKKLGVDESELDGILDQYMLQEYGYENSDPVEVVQDSLDSIENACVSVIPADKQGEFREAMQGIFAEMLAKMSTLMEQYLMT